MRYILISLLILIQSCYSPEELPFVCTCGTDIVSPFSAKTQLMQDMAHCPKHSRDLGR